MKVTADALGVFRSRRTDACSNLRTHTYGATSLRGPSGAPSGLSRSAYHSGGAAQLSGSSGHAR